MKSGVPKQCPNRDCRVRLMARPEGENGSGKVESDGAKAGVRDLRGSVSDGRVEGGVDGVPEVRGSHGGAQSGRVGVERGVSPDTGGEGKEVMSVEKFLSLSNSDKMRAQREGKF